MVLIRTAVLALMLLTIGLFASHTSAVSECCRSYTRGIIPCNAIKGYSVQTVKELCHINAIIFYTKKGRAACTNPALGWVMTCVDRLRNKAQMVHNRTSQA
ncbi:C-C motif chemokine 20a.3 [Myripristis murdjan]|uniref:C-C motif chemokine n=1 Tax=Myripristis murdjan TaxID=586833 RepID=A0A667XFX3_9TELE|nr:C-C motif chemokine 20-like [Myripristis murdjan]